MVRVIHLPRRLASLAVVAAIAGAGLAADFNTPLAPIDVAGFRDSTSHWRHIKEPQRVMQPLPNQPSYAPEQGREIAANLLLFQRDNGGWPKDYDMLAVLNEEQKKAVRDSHAREDTTFDNHTTHSQVEYLARVFAATGEAPYRAACVRGFDFILAAQYLNGGWPQTFPKHASFRSHLTFNDGVMIGILEVLRDAAERKPQFAWLDEARRDRARDAVQRGVACILKCQIVVDGVATGWCQQHDEKTYAPASARTFELASICPQETTEIVRFLMAQVKPGAEIVRTTDAAVAWLTKVQLAGLRVEKIAAPHAEFERHDTDTDTVIVRDEHAPPLWARHYEVGTNRPIFASRDGVKVYSLAEVDRERRTGSPWYGTWPAKLIERDYPNWREAIGSL